MTDRLQQDVLAARDELAAPPPARACEDQNFGMPTGIYIAMAICFGGAMTVLAIAFRGGMAVSYGIIFTFIATFFAVPTLMIRASCGRGNATALDWYRFRQSGIATATGRTPAGEATVLVLMLPFLVLCWAIAIATLAALV